MEGGVVSCNFATPYSTSTKHGIYFSEMADEQQLSPRRGIFEEQRIWSMGFQGVLGSDYEAPWGNGWGNAASVRDPGFGGVLGMGQEASIPWRKSVPRTPHMVRSLLPQPDIVPL